MKYEYKMVHQANFGEKEMNELGKDGWELVCYHPEQYSFIFKRIVEKALII